MNQEKDQEYREIFLAEALDHYTEINRLLTILEKNIEDAQAIQALFRITHTLKGNATGMGFEKIAELAHVLEDFFGEVRDGKISLGNDIFTSVFKAADALGELIEAVKNPRDVKYRGIKTKLEVLIKNAKKENAQPEVTADNFSVDEGNSASALQQAEEDDELEIGSAKVAFSDLIQVSVKKLDNLLNLVGELIIERDRIVANNRSSATNEFSRLNRISSDLQYSVMD
ncbi:MAG TPA: Hpt domain-containing protein, partial [Ohtaekwangia sp.]